MPERDEDVVNGRHAGHEPAPQRRLSQVSGLPGFFQDEAVELPVPRVLGSGREISRIDDGFDRGPDGAPDSLLIQHECHPQRLVSCCQGPECVEQHAVIEGSFDGDGEGEVMVRGPDIDCPDPLLF